MNSATQPRARGTKGSLRVAGILSISGLTVLRGLCAFTTKQRQRRALQMFQTYPRNGFAVSCDLETNTLVARSNFSTLWIYTEELPLFCEDMQISQMLASMSTWRAIPFQRSDVERLIAIARSGY